MGVFNEDDAQRLVGFGSPVTGAVGSDAALDLEADARRVSNEGVPEEETKSLAEALLQTHPDYDANVEKWTKYLDLYMSQDIYRFIHRHLREVDVSWKQRVERGYFYNYTKGVVDLFTAFLFHHPIDRKIGEQADLFEDVYKNADLSGTLWNVFMQKVCTFAQVQGHVGVLVDAPKAPEGGFKNEAERKEAGARPYLTLVYAHQIRDWEIDQFGNFIWVKLEVMRPQDRDWKQGAERTQRHFVIWTKEGWEEYVVDVSSEGTAEEARLVDSGDHDLGVIPLVIAKIDDMPTHPWFGLSAVTDIADINIAILNWSNLGDEEIFERCLNLLAMERAEGDAPVEISHANVLEYEPGTNKPEYLVPGSTPLELILKWITEARDEIRRLAKLNISTGLGDVRQSSSGIAKAFAFLETNQSLASKALGLEQVETALHRLIALWMKEDFDGSVSYPREFGVEDFLTMFQEMDAARSSLTSETAIKEREKELARKLFAGHPQKLRRKIEKEIDDADMKMAAVKADDPFGPLGPIPPGAKDDSKPGQEGEDEETSPDRADTRERQPAP